MAQPKQAISLAGTQLDLEKAKLRTAGGMTVEKGNQSENRDARRWGLCLKMAVFAQKGVDSSVDLCVHV